MIAAPRVYCLLSHYPFFDLHFQVGGRAGDGGAARTHAVAHQAGRRVWCSLVVPRHLVGAQHVPSSQPLARPA